MKNLALIIVFALGSSFGSINASNTILSSKVNSVNINPSEANPLVKAVATGDTKAVDSFIKQGVDINAEYNGMLPIHYAAKYNRVDILKALITAGADVHVASDSGLTPVRYAEKFGANDAAQFLKRFK